MSVLQIPGNPEQAAITQSLIENLKEAALSAPLRRARYCLHRTHEDAVQEMIIAFCRDSVVPVHRHRYKNESFHIIEGKAELLFYDDSGKAAGSVTLEAFGSAQPFLYRLSGSIWHTVKPLSDFVVIHEITSGPFIPEESETLYAPEEEFQ